MALTDTQLRNAKPQDKLYSLYDERRLSAEVPPKGNIRWRLKYTINGKEKRISLGTYPEVGLREAREKRDELRKMVANGIDPSDHRKACRVANEISHANTFEVIARERIAKFSHTWTETHEKKVVARLNNDLLPHLGRLPISEITPVQILAALRKIEERGALETAHRAKGDCSQIFRYAVSTGRAERDITTDLRGALPPYKGENFAAVTDPKRLGEILRIFDSYNGTLIVCSALKLVPILFVRPGELRGARWEHISLSEGVWSFQVSKVSRPHIVPLAKQAVKILNELKPYTGNGEFVFPGAKKNGRSMSENAVLSAMRSLGISKEETCGHGFRATARTIADEILNIRPDFMEHQLSHKVIGPLGRAYNRTSHLEARKAMMQTWADYLDQLKIT